MKLWSQDEELFTVIRQELFSAVVGDVMDRVGFQRQFLPPNIKPLNETMVVIGRAMPVLEADVFSESSSGGTNSLMAEPFGLMFRALDDLQPNEVYLCTGASPRYALWGELMSLRARALRACGAVLNGYSRDTRAIVRLNFPTFSFGGYAQDQGPRGKVIDFRVPIEIGQVRVRPGDIVFGDQDGVCIIPKEAEEEIVRRALEKVRGEQMVRKELEAGKSSVEVFATYQIM